MKIQVHRHCWAHHARPDGGRGGAHMRRLGLLAALAATAVTVLAVLASSGSAQSGERTIVLTQPAEWVPVLVDQRPRMGRGRGNAFSPGDQLISAHRLVDAAKRPAGRVELVCTTVSRSRSIYSARFLCTGVAHLADGDLFLGARFRPPRGDASTVRGALTGGTAAYAGARGTFISTPGVPSRRRVPSIYTFHILP